METVSINWEALGAKFARLEESKQALFFKGLAGELKTYESYYHKEAQFADVADKLTPEDKKQLEVLGILWFVEEGLR